MKNIIGVIGGSGIGEALFGNATEKEHHIDTPWGPPSGPIRVVDWNGMSVALLARHGPGHVLNPSQVPYRANIFAMKSLGVSHIIASGAVGSLRENIHPGELVIADQIIDRTYRRIPTFFDDLAVHVEFAHPFCPLMRQLLIECGKKLKTTVHDRGTYVCMEGPAFSTVAESNMHRAWGDLIGMTAMPEAKLAREAEISYALVALVTDYDCWRPHNAETTPQALLKEILGHLKSATGNALELIRTAIEELAKKPLQNEHIQKALNLAVWSEQKQISPGMSQKYGVLLDRYLKAKN